MSASVEVDFPLGHRLRVLAHRAAAHDFTILERPRLETLAGLLRPGSTIYDVGAEQGDFAAFAASIVGNGKVHLFEPTPRHWPSIRATFEANKFTPGGCFPGFASDVPREPWRERISRDWPEVSTGPIHEESAFSVVSERPDFPAVTLDDYARVTGTAPDVITIDVEGAEVLVLDGAREILGSARPSVLVSVHPPDFLSRFPAPERLFRQRPPVAFRVPLECQQEHVFRIFSEAGYVGTWLHVDHEIHWLFRPGEAV